MQPPRVLISCLPITKSPLLRVLFVVCLNLFSLAGLAHAGSWWDDDWTIRRKVTLDATAKGAAITDPIGTASVLVRLHEGNFQFNAAKEDGSDLRFVAADNKTLLTYHLEKFDSLLSEAFVWVKAPDFKPGEAVSFWLYYGNQGPKAVRIEDSKATYDVDTVLVYHFAEHGAAPVDSAISGNNAENAGTAADGSMIGSGLRLAGKGSIKIPGSTSLAWAEAGAMSWSAWIKPAVLVPNAVIFSRRDGDKAIVIGIDGGVPYVELKAAAGDVKRTPAIAPLAVNTWRQLAVVCAGSQITLYLDGESVATLAASLPALKGTSVIGGDQADAAFTGELDELQISKVARPLGFLKLQALSQGGEKAALLLNVGVEEQASTWLSGTFGILMKSLTVDGWIVIGVLVVMAVISWWVMYAKAAYLNGIARGNEQFLKAWRFVAKDLTLLDDVAEEQVNSFGGSVDHAGLKLMRTASVFRIYHIGVEEIRHRLAADRDLKTRKALSGRSIQAIRASLDGGLVRETQKLNSLMVFLTIAISGGPFLGLLGTVVGVMITFAAIAAAGDVNVNAIAPGIAAALVATVAGLVVAIPALFGYNYLTSKIKEATTDMHVFVDEFVTKMAEFYRGPGE